MPEPPLGRIGLARQPFMGLIGARPVSVAPGACVIAVDHTASLEQQNGVAAA